MIKVLVCGEGKHDVGESKRPSGDGGTTNDDGWLQAFLRRLIPLETTFVAVKRRDLVLQRRQEKKYQPLPKGHGKKALLCKIRAKAGGYDLVVFMADADSNKRRDWRRTHSDISNGFDLVPGPNGVPPSAFGWHILRNHPHQPRNSAVSLPDLPDEFCRLCRRYRVRGGVEIAVAWEIFYVFINAVCL